MTPYFLTSNPNKLREIRSFYPDIEQLDVDLPEIQEIDPHAVIRAKLYAAFAHHKGAFIVEDTSLAIESLHGLPGPFVKWFLKTVGDEGIYKMTQPFGAQRAVATCIIGYASSPDDIHYFSGEIHGKIVPPRGKAGFGWDAIFQPDGHDKTFAEMSSSEKNAISMRKIAAKKLAEHLENDE